VSGVIRYITVSTSICFLGVNLQLYRQPFRILAPEPATQTALPCIASEPATQTAFRVLLVSQLQTALPCICYAASSVEPHYPHYPHYPHSHTRAHINVHACSLLHVLSAWIKCFISVWLQCLLSVLLQFLLSG
jgi:hypothetical protein